MKKILKTIREGTFWQKSFSYIRQRIPLCMIKNRNVRILVEQEREYEKLQKEYHSVIQAGIPADTTRVQKKSNTIWICWFQGLEQAPELIKACIHSMQQNFPDKNIQIVTEENISHFIHFPSYILRKRKQGFIPDAHFSDLVRCALLCQYGGLWVDATVLCTSPQLGHFMETLPLFVYKEMDLTRADTNPIVASSWLMYARSNQRILLLTLKLLYAYWAKNNFIENYFLFHIFFALAARRYPQDWNAVPMFNNNSPHTLQFELNDDFNKDRWKQILMMSDFHKLNHHNDYSQNTNNFYHHILRLYLEK